LSTAKIAELSKKLKKKPQVRSAQSKKKLPSPWPSARGREESRRCPARPAVPFLYPSPPGEGWGEGAPRPAACLSRKRASGWPPARLPALFCAISSCWRDLTWLVRVRDAFAPAFLFDIFCQFAVTGSVKRCWRFWGRRLFCSKNGGRECMLRFLAGGFFLYLARIGDCRPWPFLALVRGDACGSGISRCSRFFSSFCCSWRACCW